MSGTVLPLPLYFFMAMKGKTLPLPLALPTSHFRVSIIFSLLRVGIYKV